MSQFKDEPFEVLTLELKAADVSTLARRGTMLPANQVRVPQPTTALLHGFDLGERPLVIGLPGLPHEIVAARTTVSLLRAHIGSTIVVLFDRGDVRRPIVIGVLQESSAALLGAAPPPLVSALVDDEKLVLTAEREVVLQCGEASITLTRAGKVLIKGTYIVSRSAGPNKIKGAAVEIN